MSGTFQIFFTIGKEDGASSFSDCVTEEGKGVTEEGKRGRAYSSRYGSLLTAFTQ